MSGLPLFLLALPVRHVAAQRPDTVRFALGWEVAEGTHPLDSVPVPLERVQGLGLGVRERRLPTTFPAFLAAYAGADGRTWVRRWSASPGRSLFDVFEPDGRFRGTIVVPRELAVEPRPVLTLQRIVGVIVDPETGAHGVGSFAAR